ncbi:MAG TPA: hypothetical protein VHC92_02460 [Rhodanobacteraceae bacterium]|nr:hypothetical protein [Rhodanobacteraceae bacterium]
MIFDYPRAYPPDAVEQRLASPAAAREALSGHETALEAMLAERRRDFALVIAKADDEKLFERTAAAVRLAFARLAYRHGRLGADFHAYHNEGHILEICAGRIPRLFAAEGARALSLRDWCALLLFGAGHDLRQREAQLFSAGIGANERASTEEMLRILDVSGFDRERDADLYIAIELMIAGSTFDARAPGGATYNAAELVQSGGALAAKLDAKLDKHRPGWRDDPALVRGQRLALIAADLDTANVAEPFAAFAANGENLCREREMLSGRSLDAGESAMPALGFLTDGQDRFFFDLHRFNSEIGHAAFDAGKHANAALLKALTVGVRARVAIGGPPATGNQVIEAYRATVADLVA